MGVDSIISPICYILQITRFFMTQKKKSSKNRLPIIDRNKLKMCNSDGNIQVFLLIFQHIGDFIRLCFLPNLHRRFSMSRLKCFEW